MQSVEPCRILPCRVVPCRVFLLAPPSLSWHLYLKFVVEPEPCRIVSCRVFLLVSSSVLWHLYLEICRRARILSYRAVSCRVVCFYWLPPVCHVTCT
jgi:hypothetical protein